MSTQVLPQTVGIQAWVALLRGHAALTRQLNADLLAEHGLTINDYEVLLHLAQAPDHRLRRVDLAERALLTPSGVTRLLEGLERSGLVRRVACSHDRRVAYAELTRTGYSKLRGASKTHLAGIHELFIERFTEAELATLVELLSRVPSGPGDGTACGVD